MSYTNICTALVLEVVVSVISSYAVPYLSDINYLQEHSRTGSGSFSNVRLAQEHQESSIDELMKPDENFKEISEQYIKLLRQFKELPMVEDEKKFKVKRNKLEKRQNEEKVEDSKITHVNENKRGNTKDDADYDDDDEEFFNKNERYFEENDDNTEYDETANDDYDYKVKSQRQAVQDYVNNDDVETKENNSDEQISNKQDEEEEGEHLDTYVEEEKKINEKMKMRHDKANKTETDIENILKEKISSMFNDLLKKIT